MEKKDNSSSSMLENEDQKMPGIDEGIREGGTNAELLMREEGRIDNESTGGTREETTDESDDFRQSTTVETLYKKQDDEASSGLSMSTTIEMVETPIEPGESSETRFVMGNHGCMEKQDDEEIDNSCMEKKNDDEGLSQINSSTNSVEKKYGEPAESYARYQHDPIADVVRIDIQDTRTRPMIDEFFEEEMKQSQDNGGATHFEGEQSGGTRTAMVEKPIDPGQSSQTRFEDTNFKEGEFTDVTDESGNSSEIKGEGRTNDGFNQTGRGEVHRTMATIELTREDGRQQDKGRTDNGTNDNNMSDTRNERRTNAEDDLRTPRTTTQNTQDNAEDEQANPVFSEWKSEDWVDAFAGLQATTGYAVGLVVGFVFFGLFGGKALGDSDKCDGGTGLSVKVLSLAVGAIICLSVSLFSIPIFTASVRGLSEVHVGERRIKLRSCYTFVNLFLLIGYALMYMATFDFVQVRLGQWWCLSTGSHLLIMSIGVAMIFMELVVVKGLYLVRRA